MEKPKRIGIIGYGALGQFLAEKIVNENIGSLQFICNRSVPQDSIGLSFPITSLVDFSAKDLESLINRTGVDLVVEVAHPRITELYGSVVLKHCDYMVGSPTVFANEELLQTLLKLSKEKQHRLFIPVGALWGAEDILRMANRGTLKGLSISMAKHPACFRLESKELQCLNDEALGKKQAIVLYEGPISKLCAMAPNNVNTMAAASIAAHTLGFSKCIGKLISDPSLKDYHKIEIEITGPTNMETGGIFSVKTVRLNPAPPGGVTGQQTYFSFLSSLKYGMLLEKTFHSVSGLQIFRTHFRGVRMPRSGRKDDSNEVILSSEENQLVDMLDSSCSGNQLSNGAEFPSDKVDRTNLRSQGRDQSKHAYRPDIDPAQTSLFLFPGQGSQFVGMGKKLLPYPGVRELYAQASDLLGYDLLAMCLTGPKEQLDKTIHCQPAVFVTSLAALERMKDERCDLIEQCVSTAGFSVGEYAALVFAGALSFQEGLALVNARAKVMQAACEAVSGGSAMTTVFLHPSNRLGQAVIAAKLYCKEKLSIDNPVISVANFLYPECKVVAGHLEAVRFVEDNKREFGISRCKRLPVSGAFHTAVMRSAADVFAKEALKSIEFKQPRVPVYSNVTAKSYQTPVQLAHLLKKQLYKPVLWEQTMHVLYTRPKGTAFPTTVECGPSRQLGALLRMTNLKAYSAYVPVDC